MPKKVFISYRREDTASAAGRVYDRLAPLLAKSNVFFDVSTLGGGDDVAQRIASEIGNCDAALVFIGEKRFEQAPQGGAPRIFEPNDYVPLSFARRCRESCSSCRSSSAAPGMPKQEQLPEDIGAITTKKRCRIATRASTTIPSTSWRRCWPVGDGTRLGREGLAQGKDRLCDRRRDRRRYTCADWSAVAFLALGATALRIDRRVSHHASAHCQRSPARGWACATKCGSGDCVETNAHHPSMGANTVCSCSTPFSVNAPRLRSSCSDSRRRKESDSSRPSPRFRQRSARREARFTSWPMTV